MTQTSPRPHLSVVIPTLNERANIAACIESVLWADEIYVVDSGSVDSTVDMVRGYPVHLVHFTYQPGGPKKYNWSLENLPFTNEWVLLLDADERVSPRLREEICAAIASECYVGYYINVQYIFLGGWLRHCWNPVWRMRLFKHRLGRFERLEGSEAQGTGDNEVHEQVMLQGRAGFLREYIIHHDYKPYAAWVDKHNRYSTWEAATYVALLKEPPALNPVSYLRATSAQRRRMLKGLLLRLPGRPLIVFLWLYIWRRGFLDGYRGLAFSLSIAYHWLSIGIKIKEAELTKSVVRSEASQAVGQEEALAGKPALGG
jgi:glycosyltransferase involved in cell wall biosynthesis